MPYTKAEKIKTAERLADLRKGQNLSYMQLSKRLKDLGNKISHTSLKDYEETDFIDHSSAFNKSMSIANLVALADFYGVSYDYLLGKSENEKRENIDIGKYLGLSDKAIHQIQHVYLTANQVGELKPSGIIPPTISDEAIEKINGLFSLNAVFESEFLFEFNLRLSVLLIDYIYLQSLKDHTIEITDEDIKQELTSEFYVDNDFNGPLTSFKPFDTLSSHEKEGLRKKLTQRRIVRAEEHYNYAFVQFQETLKKIITTVISNLFIENKECFSLLYKSSKTQNY